MNKSAKVIHGTKIDRAIEYNTVHTVITGTRTRFLRGE